MPRILLVLLILVIPSLGMARKPAVEDFVGLEVEPEARIPQGTETMFNFEKDMGRFEDRHTQKLQTRQVPVAQFAPSTSAPWSTAMTMGAIFILALPFLSWLLVMNHLKRKATLETVSNIEILDNYRRERELARRDQNERKAS